MPLLHRLQQRGLGLGGGAVDLVGEDHVGEDRPGDERELAAAGLGVVLEDVGPGDVRRHHVGRELDPAERQAEDLRHRADQQRLGQPRHADEQDVPAGEEAREELLDHVVLADDHLGDLGPHRLVFLGQRGDGRDLVAGGLVGAVAVGHAESSGRDGRDEGGSVELSDCRADAWMSSGRAVQSSSSKRLLTGTRKPGITAPPSRSSPGWRMRTSVGDV